MSAKPTDVETYSQLIRLAFQRLRDAGEVLHADAPVNLSQRAILEWLSIHGFHSVPKIAEAKAVSRQHVQKVVDELAEKRLVRFEANPGHKRSPIVELTETGKALFANMRRNEAVLIGKLAQKMDAAAIEQAAGQLRVFMSELAKLTDEARGKGK
jgi:DNA-binding MarR family transcriptional regulator